MKFQLEHQFRFESARFLPELPESHPCRRLHGHSFLLTVRLVGEKDPQVGWVIDFSDIQKAVLPVIKELDHRVLNEVEGLANPTSENICVYIYERVKPRLPGLLQVLLQETPETRCIYPAL